jgi:hypothetical protein
MCQQSFPAINTIQGRPTGVASLPRLDMYTVHISTKKNKYLLILLDKFIDLQVSRIYSIPYECGTVNLG